MGHATLLAQLQEMLGIVLYMALPPLLGAVVVGLVIGILQAATQVQDQSMPLTFKLLVVIAILGFGGPVLVVPLLREATAIFDGFATMVR